MNNTSTSTKLQPSPESSAIRSEKPLLEIASLDAYYGQTQALFGINAKVHPGSVTVFLGANGAGKTSCLRAICGMLRTRGEIRIDGMPVQNCATEDIVRLGVAHVPDGRGTFAQLTTEENLRLGAFTRRDHGAVREDIEQMFVWFPRLKERFHQQAGTLSGGEQQMLAIARALMLRPRLLLLDEPSFGVAPKVISEIFDVLERIRHERQVSILLVEQDAHLALEFADDAYLLETGQVVLSGKASELAADEAVRRSYLGY